ncbi:hypothetical protein B0H11DRAFT_2026097 [Mycena galericulata]|nr:hypothetical protein B0H11DRAFT_2026097 [Mycena galericulata]
MPRQSPVYDPGIETCRRHTSTSWRVQNRNEPLSKLEIGTIHASVLEARRDLKQLESDLKRAKRAVQKLSKEHHKIRKYIAAELALLSPIRDLPREMLAEIFVHHSRMFSAHDGYIKASLTVSQVCSGWRKVAHATAVLWVRFPLYYCADYRHIVPELQMALYNTWLARVGSLPCDVALRTAPDSMAKNAGGYYDDKPTISLRPIYDYDRSPRKDQWKMLDMEYIFDETVKMKSIASVQSLIVNVPHPDQVKRSELLVGEAADLEELVLLCPQDTFNKPIVLPRLPLETLKHCELDKFPLTNGLQILQQTTALETFKWTTAYADTEEEDQMPTVASNIHTLILSIWGAHCHEGLSPLFSHLTAPQLEKLQILWMYHPESDSECDASPYWDSPTFQTFLTRSAASLTSLTLHHADIPEAELIALLEHTPMLVTFDLSDRYARRDWNWAQGIEQMLGASILRRLLPPSLGEPAPPLVPKLEVLKLRGGFEGNDICDADILRVFEARYPDASSKEMEYARLSEGAFHLLRRADQQLGGKLQLAERAARLRKRGLNFDFTTLEPDPDDVEEEEEEDSEGSISST